ncbi:RidA family protein [Pusillimonas noertemannii]|uniref:RidA family protein n=1 Tax=Pusillimonas noertemannii TaxID=305977 RepID=UPI000F633FCA
MTVNTEHPYSFVLESEGVVYVSGATTIDYTTHLPVPGRREPLDAALDEIERRLATVQLSLRSVVKVSYYLTDISLRTEVNAQFEDRFPHPRPARSVMGISSAPYGGCAVIDIIAHRSRENA